MVGLVKLCRQIRLHLSYKLKSLKAKPRDWNKTLQGNLEMQKFDTLNQLLELENIMFLRISTKEEIRNKIALTMDFEEIAMEEMTWRQGSRALWLKHCDNNTKLLRKTANARRRYNNIDLLEIYGDSIRNHVDMKKEIISFYQNLYAEIEDWRSHDNMKVCPTIPTKII